MTQQQLQQIIQLRQSKTSYLTISKTLQIPKTTVYNAFKEWEKERKNDELISRSKPSSELGRNDFEEYKNILNYLNILLKRYKKNGKLNLASEDKEKLQHDVEAMKESKDKYMNELAKPYVNVVNLMIAEEKKEMKKAKKTNVFL